MKAAVLTGHGGNEVVAVGEQPMPDRKPGGAPPAADLRYRPDEIHDALAHLEAGKQFGKIAIDV